LTSLIFWDAKRPITTEVLQRLDLRRVAARLGMSHDFDAISPIPSPSSQQPTFAF
jgi:hypothetical protein